MSNQNSDEILNVNQRSVDLTRRRTLFKQFHHSVTSPSLEIPLPSSEVNLSPLPSDIKCESEIEGSTSTPHSGSSPLRPLVTVPSDCDQSTAYRPSHVSLLAGKYLLFANCTGGSNKDFQKCINVETREQFSCKIVPRNANGLGLLAAYHRLEEFSDSIGAIQEIVLSPKSLYLIFPVNFGSVHSYILAKKRISEPEAVHLFKQIVSAVHHCHGKGIVLRDLKMGKFVFFDKERTTVKLESLEDAVILNDSSDDGLSDKHGCPNYVSPEKADILRSNSKYPGKATDIWGLGVILYTMLVGRYPFNDADHTKLFVKIRKGHFSLPDSLSSPVKCLIRCLLRKDPSGRLTCQQILKHPWLVGKGSETSQPTDNIRCRIRPSSSYGYSVGNSSQQRSLNMSVIQSTQLKRESSTDYANAEDQVVPDIGVGISTN